MTERGPIPDCLNHLRQLLPKRTASDDDLIRELRYIAELELAEMRAEDTVLKAAARLEELLSA
jgi:hypothetical protein